MARTPFDRTVVRPPCPRHPGSRIRLDGYWHCPAGHEWSTVVYQRTLSGSGCPDCYRAEAAARSKAGKAKARAARDAAERAKIIELPRRVSGDGPD